MVGGVSSPVRSFRAVGGSPLFISRGRGSTIWDVDNKAYLDYVCSWGPLIAGHCHPKVVKAVSEAVGRGSSFGAPTEPELRLAEKLCSSVPSIEMVRFVSSGTEATMSALRLARAFTKRSKVLKFDGCYHGHSDAFLTTAGSGLATFDVPSPSGVPRSYAEETVTVPYNDIPSLEAAFRDHGNDLAAVIVEPVAGNMGVVPPADGFLRGMRKLCTESGALLIFDEVITGFRLSSGGAQGVFGIAPDLTCLGKIIGGGFPVGAYGGRREVMRLISPEGPVYQAGTLSGNPVAMTAGLATISLAEKGYGKLESLSRELEQGLLEESRRERVPVSTNRVGSMTGLFFSQGPVRNFHDARMTNADIYRRFHRSMLRQGVYLPPSAFETIFLSLAHSREDVAKTIAAAKKALKDCRSAL